MPTTIAIQSLKDAIRKQLTADLSRNLNHDCSLEDGKSLEKVFKIRTT